MLRSYDIFLSFYLIEQSKYVEIEIILHEIFPLKFQFHLSIRTRTRRFYSSLRCYSFYPVKVVMPLPVYMSITGQKVGRTFRFSPYRYSDVFYLAV